MGSVRERVDNMAQEELKLRLTGLLKDIFQFDSEDLDFGIYKIMNYKKKEIRNFIDKELIETINKQLKSMGEEAKRKKKEKADQLKNEIKEKFGENAFKNGEIKDEFKDTPLGKQYTEALKELKRIKISEELEADIYNHIINFFSRYCDKGDFISKRRYGRNERYVIPYGGEEILLHWANNDQYYVKTTEWFRKYTFKVKGLTVNFRVADAEEEKNNIKAENNKHFVLGEKQYLLNGNELDIYFEFRELTKEEKKKFGERAKQDDINKHILADLKEKLEKKAKPLFEKENNKTILEKQLFQYTRRSTMDYFIHKNLKQFLERELDFYIKNEILNLENLDSIDKEKLDSYLLVSKVVKNISQKIIDFLAQIEDFQKKLWEKKKFVISTDYVITLNKIKDYAGEDFLKSILEEVLDNKGQVREWKELLGVEPKSKDNLIENQQKVDGKVYKKFPIDTKFFDEEFKWKLIVSLSKNNGLDDLLDGVLIKSENWQALNTVMNKYREKVRCIYIDPPYNTGSDEFLYKDNYQHSSWLTMMENRLKLARELMERNGVISVSIDDREMHSLRNLSNVVFSDNNFKNAIIVKRGAKSIQAQFDTVDSIGVGHEYILMYSRFPERRFPKILIGEPKEQGSWNNHWRGTDRPTMRYELFGITPKTGQWRWSQERSLNAIDNYRRMVAELGGNGDKISQDMIDDWYNQEAEKAGQRIDLLRLSKNGKPEHYVPQSEGKLLSDLWGDIQSSNSHGLKNLFGRIPYNNPKSLSLIQRVIRLGNGKVGTIVDFFAGSGTTAHAVIKLNKEDGGKRKFILVEMTDYFDTVIIPGIKKLAYSYNWGDGKPQDTQGDGLFFKYQSLEQYEDSLENIEFEQKTISEFEDYFVKYMLGFETKNSKTFLRIDEMQDPFNYRIKIMKNYQIEIVNVDLVETFNYLLGLETNRIKVTNENKRKYVFVFGEVNGCKVLVVWRSIKGIDFNKDKEIIEKAKEEVNPDETYVNGDAGVKGFKQIETEFKSLLW